MLQTTNYKLNQIERTDKIKDSIDAISQNVVEIDRLIKSNEDNIGTVDKNIENINKDIVTIGTAVEDMGKELDEIEENIEKIDDRLIKAEEKIDRAETILPTTTASGEHVYIDNAVNYPLIGLSGEGKCEQAGEPSPDNPQEIKTVTEADYKGVGKNLIDLTQLTSTSNPIKLAGSGCVISDKNIDSMVLTAVGTWCSAYLDFQEDYFKENEDIVVSSKFLETISGRTSQVGYTVYGSNDGSTYSTIKSDAAHEIKYNVSTKISTSINVGTYKYIRIRIWANATATSVTSGESVINVSELMIARGTDPTFEPYQESTLPIDLQGNEFCKVGDIADKLLIDRKGNVAIEKNIKEVEITADNIGGRTVLSNQNILYRCNNSWIKDALANVKVLCNRYIGVEAVPSRKDGTIYYNEGVKTIDIIDNNANITTVDEFKTWLSENPVTVYYALATPQIIQLGKIENPEIFKGINNIAVETNLGNMNVGIEYVEDLQTRIEKIEQAIVSLGGI